MTLANYLESTGETRTAFAERIGVSRQTVSALCSGSTPTVGTLAAIKLATGGRVTLDDFTSSGPTRPGRNNRGGPGHSR